MAEPGRAPLGRGGRGAAILLAMQQAQSASARRPGEGQQPSAAPPSAPGYTTTSAAESSVSSMPLRATQTGYTGVTPMHPEPTKQAPQPAMPMMGRAARLDASYMASKQPMPGRSLGRSMAFSTGGAPAVGAAGDAGDPSSYQQMMPSRGIGVRGPHPQMMPSRGIGAPGPHPQMMPSRGIGVPGPHPQTLVSQSQTMSAVGGGDASTRFMTASAGRGLALQQLKTESGLLEASTKIISSHSAEVQPATRMMEKLSVEPKKNIEYFGTEGQRIRLSINHIPILFKSGQGHVYEYAVLFNPAVDSRNMRFKLVKQHNEFLGRARTFDGSKMYLPILLTEQNTVLTSTHPFDNSAVEVTFRFKAKRNLSECPQLFNMLFKRVLSELNLVQIGRNSFDPNASVQIKRHNLELWPGYITAIQEFKGGLMLAAETSHRVLRTQTVLELLYEIQRFNPTNFRDVATRAVIGNVILTKYNKKTYRIDDISWNQTPMATFDARNSEPISYLDYYRKQYNETIRDVDQPLLIHRAKRKAQGEEDQTMVLALIPELSYLTGLTDDMRSDFGIMKDIGSHTRLSPNQRQFQLMKLVNCINANPAAKEHLDSWGMEIRPETIQLDGRVLKEERIFFSKTSALAGVEANWSRDLGKCNVVSAVSLHKWVVIYTRKDQQRARDFVNMALRVSQQLGIQMSQPNDIMLHDERNNALMQSLRESITPDLQLVCVINPTSRDDRYSLIKKACCISNPIPSQVINGRTISNPSKLRSVAQNIVLQMNCKLGGELWSLEIPLKNLMVCGIDVYHDTTNKSKSVLGLVSSLNQTLTRWYCRSSVQMSGQEIGTGLEMCFMQCIRKYHQVNHMLPEKIIIFRDGVGDGQLDYVSETEVSQIYSSFKSFGESYVPVVTFIVVQKRINTRIFSHSAQGRNNLDNPPPGTVVDQVVTKKYWQDFFLVSQHVRQGTVTPTHFVVIHNTSNLTADKVQRISYKMTHLYYNWPGTIRVPAPCQYAHKLASLIGQHLHALPSDELCDRLFFL